MSEKKPTNKNYWGKAAKREFREAAGVPAGMTLAEWVRCEDKPKAKNIEKLHKERVAAVKSWLKGHGYNVRTICSALGVA